MSRVCISVILLFELIITGFSADKAFSQAKSAISIPRLSQEIHFDGIVEEAEWYSVKSLPMSGHWPAFNVQPGKNSVIRVAYDDKYLYMSAILYEDPENIQESSFKRDENWSLKFDHISLILDTYNDAENAVQFVVSPVASKGDQTIQNDGLSRSNYNSSWNSYWDAKTNRFDKGWQAEIRIPFSSLRFTSHNNITEMGLIAYRYSAHDKKMDTYPGISNDYGFFSFAKPSQGAKVTMENIPFKKPLYFSPYVLGNVSRRNILNDVTQEFEVREDDKISGGFDLQYGISKNINMDVTFNTDFAQVEADNQQVNLTRFSLFFPEKRQFFQERSSTFDFNFDNNNKLFYSRRIGLKSGEIVPLWGGIRFVGRADKFDFGFLDMQSKNTDLYKTENYGIVRFRRDIINSTSYAGGILASSVAADGTYNFAYGVDAVVNPFGDEYIKFNFAQTFDDADTAQAKFYDRSRFLLEWQRRKNIGLGYQLNFNYSGKYYNPQLGFEERKDYWRLGDKVFYNFFMKDDSRLQRIDFTLQTGLFFKNLNNKIESTLIEPGVEIAGKKESVTDATIKFLYDQPADTFNLSKDIFIVPASYWNKILEISYQSPRIYLINGAVGFTYGKYYGGTIYSPSVTFQYMISKYVGFQVDYEYNNIRFPQFPTFESHLLRFNVNGAVNVKWTLATFLQYNSTANNWTLNSRLRFNPRDGVNLYLVYNENYNSKLDRETPHLPASSSHSIILKFSYTLPF